jgi:hypothetical protein
MAKVPPTATSSFWTEYETKISPGYLPDIEMAENSSNALFTTVKSGELSNNYISLVPNGNT